MQHNHTRDMKEIQATMCNEQRNENDHKETQNDQKQDIALIAVVFCVFQAAGDLGAFDLSAPRSLYFLIIYKMHTHTHTNTRHRLLP